jgi:alpha-tubulin suppressor-like RCC1 family protein
LFTWGRGNGGQLGTNDTVSRSFATQIATSWAEISSGVSATTAIKSDGTLWSWGLNTNGQLGLGDTLNRSSPTQIGSASNWTFVNRNGFVSFISAAINSLGQLWVWGNNAQGQLGDGTTVNKSTPVQISGSWVQVDLAGRTSVGIDSNYKLYIHSYGS